MDFVADLAANWSQASRKSPPAGTARVAIVLANYPNKDGRIANGVGYDTPASTVAIIGTWRGRVSRSATYPRDGNALIEALQRGPTNAPPAAQTSKHAVTFIGGRPIARISRTSSSPYNHSDSERWGEIGE